MDFKKLPAKIREYAQLGSLTVREAKVLGEPPLPALLRMVSMLTRERFSTRELTAYAPHLSHYRKAYPVLISKDRSLAGLAKLNNADESRITEDKHLFYQHCAKHGVRTPSHLFSTGSDDARLERWLGLDTALAFDELPEHFVIKERFGAYGSGFRSYSKEAGKLVSNGQSCSLEQFRTELVAPGTEPLVVQERVFDHPALSKLSASNGLQTLRLVTRKSEEGDGEHVELVFFILKLLASGNETDNFDGGKSGNLIAFGDPANGTLKAAIAGRSDRLGLAEITRHPKSNANLAGFQVPLWSESLDLAAAAHRSFDKLGVIGWDLALTETGPKLLEGNAWFDPPLYAPHLLSENQWRHLFVATSAAEPQ